MITTTPRLILVDDDPVIQSILQLNLEKQAISVRCANSLLDLEKQLRLASTDIVVLDLVLGNEDGRDAIPIIIRHAPKAKIIVLSATTDVELAANVISRGANAFIRKRGDIAGMAAEILSHLDLNAPSCSDLDSDSQCEEESDFGIIGGSPEIVTLRKSIKKLGSVDSTILILGESGTGKELVARGLHQASSRRKFRFEAINCSAIPEALLEAELFGYKKGAFTDAKMDHKGIFEVCSKGTLFLDEIGEMPLNLQAKLLRVLQEKVVTPLGSTTSIRIDTRVVAATNRDIRQQVKQGKFREDLYFRLSVVPIMIPPLRQRKADISILAEYFIEQFCSRLDRRIGEPSKSVMASLQNYSWPGNVRELQNAIERGIVLASDQELTADNIFLGLEDEIIPETILGDAKPFDVQSWFQCPLSEAKVQFEKAYISQVLKTANGNVSEAARISGRYRPDLYRLMHKYGITKASPYGETSSMAMQMQMPIRVAP